MLGVKVCELCHPSTRGHRWCCWIASSPKVFLLISLVGRKLHLNLQSGSIHNLFLYVEMLWVVGCCSFFLLNWALGNCKLLNKFQGSNTSKTIIIHNRSFNRLSKRITCAKQMWILTREIIKDRWYLRFSGVNLQRHFLASSQKFDTSTMFGGFFCCFFPFLRTRLCALLNSLWCITMQWLWWYHLSFSAGCQMLTPKTAGWAWFTGACGLGCCLSLQLVCYYKALDSLDGPIWWRKTFKVVFLWLEFGLEWKVGVICSREVIFFFSFLNWLDI